MGAILSAALSWVFQVVILKFVIFTGLYLVVTSFVGFLLDKLSVYGPTQLLAAMDGFTPAMWYFFDFTMFTQFFPAMISAYILRFSIRRIPFLG